MRVLVDTQILLWVLTDDPQLTPKARKILQSANGVYFSAASLWELAIKKSMGKIDMDLEWLKLNIELSGIIEISVSTEHVIGLMDLDPIHKDPFDRIIVAVAKTEPMRLLTGDKTVASYTDLAILV